MPNKTGMSKLCGFDKLVIFFLVGIVLNIGLDYNKGLGGNYETDYSTSDNRAARLKSLQLVLQDDLETLQLDKSESFSEKYISPGAVDHCIENTRFKISPSNSTMSVILNPGVTQEQLGKELEDYNSLKRAFLYIFGSRERKVIHRRYANFGLNISYFFHYDQKRYQMKRRSKLFSYVVSDPTIDAFNRRQSIRQTWGKDARTKPVFVISIRGLDEGNELTEEFFYYQDLILIDLPTGETSHIFDAYRSLLVLDAVTNHLKRPGSRHWKWMVRVTDRSYVSSRKLYFYLMSKYKSQVWGICYGKHELATDRFSFSKDCVDEFAFPDDFYPPSCDTTAYSLDRSALQCVLDKAAKGLEYVPVEDLMMGILLEKCSVTVPGGEQDFIVEEQWTTGDAISKMVYNNLNQEKLEELYRRIVQKVKAGEASSDFRLLLLPIVVIVAICVFYFFLANY